jgi:hypothetical protein
MNVNNGRISVWPSASTPCWIKNVSRHSFASIVPRSHHIQHHLYKMRWRTQSSYFSVYITGNQWIYERGNIGFTTLLKMLTFFGVFALLKSEITPKNGNLHLILKIRWISYRKKNFGKFTRNRDWKSENWGLQHPEIGDGKPKIGKNPLKNGNWSPHPFQNCPFVKWYTFLRAFSTINTFHTRSIYYSIYASCIQCI